MAGKVLTTPRVLGAAFVAVAAVGIYLGSKLPGLGIGVGGGAGSGNSESGDISGTHVAFPAQGDARTAVTPDQKTVPKESVAGGKAKPTLEIIVDGAGYALKTDDSSAKRIPLTLDQLPPLLQSNPGDSDGVRVRIFRRGNALPSAEEKLDAALRAANVPASAVHKVDGLLE